MCEQQEIITTEEFIDKASKLLLRNDNFQEVRILGKKTNIIIKKDEQVKTIV